MITIDARSSKPIFEQIVDGIKENIVKGILTPGQKIPSIREMSRLLTVNPNTVSKAFAELERQRVIETIAGRGTFVSSGYKPRIDEDRLHKIKSSLKDIVVEAHYIGLDKEGIINIIKQIYSDIEGK
ncbi:MAG: GntR family transcriptional regulator [Bacillota bacterium]